MTMTMTPAEKLRLARPDLILDNEELEEALRTGTWPSPTREEISRRDVFPVHGLTRYDLLKRGTSKRFSD
jgi:hypothetical protein